MMNNGMRDAFAKQGYAATAKTSSATGREAAVYKDFVDEAEGVIKNLKKDKYDNIILKTTQIRKFLTAVNALRNRIDVYACKNIDAEKLSPELAAEVKFLKVDALYLVGREKAVSRYIGPVEDFVQKAQLAKKITEIGDDLKNFEQFCKYIEALVAFHKYYGGRD